MTLEYFQKIQIDIKKVGITGWSRGGMNSLAIAETRIRDTLISKDIFCCFTTKNVVNIFPQPIKETKIWMVNV